MGRPLKPSEMRLKRASEWDGVGDRTPSGWDEVHDRLLLRDLARRQDLDELIAAEDAAHAVRSAKWRAEVERQKARRDLLRRSPPRLRRPAAAPAANESLAPVSLDPADLAPRVDQDRPGE
jgi:hypothetical protein